MPQSNSKRPSPMNYGKSALGQRLATMPSAAQEKLAKPEPHFFSTQIVEQVTSTTIWQITGSSTPEQILAMVKSGKAIVRQDDSYCSIILKRTNERLATAIHKSSEFDGISGMTIKNRKVKPA